MIDDKPIMSMVEKVARGLYPAYDWGVENSIKDIMHSTAKAAILAMREPTKEMEIIADKELDKLKMDWRDIDLKTKYQAMIDAALKE